MSDLSMPDFTPDTLRVPPHSLEAETSVLGGLLLDNSAWDRIGDLLVEADFYRHEHRVIFGAISALLLASKPADVVTVLEHLQSRGKEQEAGGIAYLGQLTQYMPSTGTLRRYAEIIRDKAILRGLAAVSDEIATEAFNPQGQSVDAILDKAEARVLRIGESRRKANDEWVEVYDGMLEHTQVLEERAAGKVEAMPTGLADLDEYLEGGLRPGELVIVGARPSMGKTALGMTIGVHMAARYSVALMSMEMSHAEVRDRLVAMLGSVGLPAVKRPNKGEGLEWGRVLDGVERAKSLRLAITDQGGLNINQVRTKARAIARKRGLDVLVLDYIGLMTGLDPKANRNTQLGEISRGLKSLGKELGCAILCLAQLNRKSEERPDQMPQMSDLRDSGEIEQDADVILFIKRPIMANPDLGAEWNRYAKLSVAKNRQGRCGYLHLSYQGEQTKFTCWAGEPPRKQEPMRTSQRRTGMDANV